MKVTLPKEAVDILKEVIEENKDRPGTIRINFRGFGCTGPVFGISLDEQQEEDVECVSEGINFIMDKEEYEKYGDVTILETSYGFMITVENMPEGDGCSSCNGCGF